MTDAELVRRYLGLYNAGDAEGLGVFYAPDVVLVDPMSPETTKGREAVLATGSAFRRAFPDMVWTLIHEPLVGSGGHRLGTARHRNHDGPHARAPR